MGLTLKELEALAGSPSFPNISLIERGIQKPHAKTRKKLEKVLGKIDWDRSEVDPDNVLVQTITKNLCKALQLPKEHQEEVLETLKAHVQHFEEELVELH
jgi:transcriptional regulator with XRE-family HTH domain